MRISASYRKFTKARVLIGFLLLMSAGTSGFACDCLGKNTVEGGVQTADIVFSGTVISSAISANYDSLGIVVTGDSSKVFFDWKNYPSRVVSFRVERIYKGQFVDDTITVVTPPNSGACGVRFETGKKYIVYGTITESGTMAAKLKRRTYDDKLFWTHQCTRTREWDKSEEDEILRVTQ